MEENKEKRLLRVELDDDVKKVSITGMNSDEKVVMRQELSEDDMQLVTGGAEMYYFESYDETTGASTVGRYCKVDEQQANIMKNEANGSATSVADEQLTSGRCIDMLTWGGPTTTF